MTPQAALLGEVPIDEASRSVVALLGGDLPTRTLVRRAAQVDGWAVRELPWRQPVVAVADWTRVSLVVLIGEGVTGSMALLDALRRSGYEGSFVLLTTEAPPAVRKRAFQQGALDVMEVPADPRVLAARVCTVLRSRQSALSPPAPDTP